MSEIHTLALLIEEVVSECFLNAVEMGKESMYSVCVNILYFIGVNYRDCAVWRSYDVIG